MLNINQKIKRLEEKFQENKELDSFVFIEIPQPDLELRDYKFWLIEEVETKWMKEFNSNEHYRPKWKWNEEEEILEKIIFPIVNFIVMME